GALPNLEEARLFLGKQDALLFALKMKVEDVGQIDVVVHEGIGILPSKEEHGQTLHQGKPKIRIGEILLQTGHLLEDVPKKDTVFGGTTFQEVHIVRHFHFGMRLVEPLIVLDRPVIVERYLLLPGDLLHIIQARSEEHTSELQSRENLVCRL